MKGIMVKVKPLRPEAELPKYATPGSAGFDLVSMVDTVIEPGEVALIPTGLAFELPPGYMLQVVPRSGISLNTALRVANSPGIVDSDFRGETCVIVENINPVEYEMVRKRLDFQMGYVYDLKGNIDKEFKFGDFLEGSYVIRKGDRIAQGIIVPVLRANFIVVDQLSETERGAGGFGSTGTRSDQV